MEQAVEDAGTFENSAVREALVGQTFDAPQGPVEVMPNHHLAQTVRIGLIKPEGGFEILEETDGVVYPQAWTNLNLVQKVMHVTGQTHLKEKDISFNFRTGE